MVKPANPICRADTIAWEALPTTLSLDIFRKLCHISKKTARYLLQNGLVPCTDTGKKTKNYRIRREDVQSYMEKREIAPEQYPKPKNLYANPKVSYLMVAQTLSQRTQAFEHLLASAPDALSTADLSQLLHCSGSTLCKYCRNQSIPNIWQRSAWIIPKIGLAEALAKTELALPCPTNPERKTVYSITPYRAKKETEKIK
ncbi:MAG: helix-turn-helix domain-containing protein [Faecalibacterium sp.]|jgi:hypothetical protein|nr:helix-turn-helix domain-containing protein [Faecalibacterium sp.]